MTGGMPRSALVLWILTINFLGFRVAKAEIFECPAKKGVEFVDVGITDFDIKQSRQELSIKRNSQKGVICILAKIVKARPDAPDVSTANKDSKSSDFHIFPLARAVDKKNWHKVAGKFGVRTKVTKCNSNRVCTVSISKDQTADKKRYVLMTLSNGNKSFDDELSRFFTQSTFGPTRDMIKDWKYEKNKNGMIRWVQEQISSVPATNHRVYYRERLDDDSSRFHKKGGTKPVVPMHPCDAYSKWRNLTFDHFDFRRRDIDISKLPDGKTLISKHGLPRTVVDKLEVRTPDGTVEVGPGTYEVIWRMEGRIGGLIYLDGHGLYTAELIGGNPPLYLPPEIMNNSSYVTGSVGINTIQMPADTSDASFYEFIEPIAPTGGILGENRIWNGKWSPYKVKEMYRLRQSIPLANSGCTDLGGNRSQNVYALMPDFSTTGRYLRYAPHMNWQMNTPDAAIEDGGWAVRELGAAWTTNVQPNPFNVERCKVQTNRTISGPIYAPVTREQDIAVVCGSEGEVARRPDLSPEEMAFRPGHTDTWFFSSYGNPHHVWAMVVLSAKDQLRQRVAWALSQIFIINIESIGDGFYYKEMYLNYYDIFVRHAFGNYGDILREVTFSPLMGEMLTFMGSQSPYYVERYTGIKSSEPDENYAREFMQLFTVGLEMLKPDGTPMKRNGKIIPTYDTGDIKTFARAWTGFAKSTDRSNFEGHDARRFFNSIDPMDFKSGSPNWNVYGRDAFPKADILGGYIGDRYPLCIDLPEKQFLRKGATYRHHGSYPIAKLDPNPDFWAHHGTWKQRRVDLVLDSQSSLYKKLCNPDPDGTCNFSAVTKLEDNLKCYGIECELDVVRSVKIVSNVGDAYIEYVKPPCVEMSFDSINMKTAKQGTVAVCANSKLNNVAFDACCRTTGTRTARHECKYTGERVSYATSKARCESQTGYPDAQMCSDFDNLDKQSEPVRFQCSFPQFYITDTYWTSSACKVSIKVNEDGFVALIHQSATNTTAPSHLNANNTHFFKVHWAKDEYPLPSNNCGSIEPCAKIGEHCYCDVMEKPKRVFRRNFKPRSASEIISKLTTGAPDPSSFDEGEYSNITLPGRIEFTVHHKNGTKAFSRHTIFGLKYHGKQIYLKNEKSRVQIGNQYSFRNPPHFLNFLNPVARDAYDETNAVFDHFLYHPNTPVLVALKLIERFGTSNPTPGYVQRVANAFKKGKYIKKKAGVDFGDGNWGNLAATTAAVILDGDVRSMSTDADPSSGFLREPTLSIFAFMRAMNMTKVPWAPHVELNWGNSGNVPFYAASIFGFFLSEYAEPGQIETAGLRSPEAGWYDTVHSVHMINGFISLIELGLTWCYDGWGGRTTVYKWVCGEYTTRYQNNEVSRANLNYEAPSNANAEEVVNELSMLLTAGRMNAASRKVIEDAYSAELTETGNAQAALRVAQRLVVLTPEFHTTAKVRMHEAPRPSYEQPEPTDGQDYKSVVFLYLNGGMDGFNMLIPHSDCQNGKDMFAEYEEVRTFNKMKKDELLVIDATESNQVCNKFGLHPAMQFMKQLYDEGDLAFLANIGMLNELCDVTDFGVKTTMQLGSHNKQRVDVLRNDVTNQHAGRGVSGRLLDSLRQEGFKTNSIGVGKGGRLTLSSYNTPQITLNANGDLTERGIPFRPHTRNDTLLAALNKESKLGSSMLGEIWSDGLQAGLEEYDVLRNVIKDTTATTSFPQNWYGQRLQTISRLIKIAPTRGHDREVFFTEVYGWDHHFDVGPGMQSGLSAVDEAMAAFVAELKLLGRWDDTVVITLSDFGRTLRMNGNNGTDHGWANNYFITGGAVKGGKILGSYPESLKSEDNLHIYGGISIPTTPLDSAWKAVAEWMGVTSEAGLDLAVPNMKSFPEAYKWGKEVLFN